jgi:hypothetical protein
MKGVIVPAEYAIVGTKGAFVRDRHLRVGTPAKANTQKESVPTEPKVKVGDVAPDFTLVDGNGQPHSLRDYKGKKSVVLAFYVWAFSPN